MPKRKGLVVGGPSSSESVPKKRQTEKLISGKSEKRRHRPGTKALIEIRKYQASTDLLIRRLPFARVVRDVTFR